MINYLLVAHLLAATVWTGGHLMLSVVVLPKVLVTREINALLSFESNFEKIGMPALVIQVITGLWMAYRLLPSIPLWFTWNNDLSLLITFKLSLLLATFLVAIHARFRVIPTLSERTLTFFAIHIFTVTTLSVGFVVVGSLFRTGFS